MINHIYVPWAALVPTLAELLDNSLDEVRNGATFVNIDLLENSKYKTRMLLVEDNDGGMDPDKMRQYMSLGYSAKSQLANTIGQYGNSFKTSTVRLGADVLVFSRSRGENGKRQDIQLRGGNRDEKNIDMATRFPNSKHFLTYRHSLRMVADVTIGFVKDAKHHVDVQGFNVYHRNRLIKPFWRVWTAAGSGGRGVIGVLEANFIEPAHDKQDFERTTLLARLENRLVQMQKDYWSGNAHRIGYVGARPFRSSETGGENSPEGLLGPQSSPGHSGKNYPKQRNTGNWQKILWFVALLGNHYMVLLSPCINQTWNLKNYSRQYQALLSSSDRDCLSGWGGYALTD